MRNHRSRLFTLLLVGAGGVGVFQDPCADFLESVRRHAMVVRPVFNDPPDTANAVGLLAHARRLTAERASLRAKEAGCPLCPDWEDVESAYALADSMHQVVQEVFRDALRTDRLAELASFTKPWGDAAREYTTIAYASSVLAADNCTLAPDSIRH